MKRGLKQNLPTKLLKLLSSKGIKLSIPNGHNTLEIQLSKKNNRLEIQVKGRSTIRVGSVKQFIDYLYYQFKYFDDNGTIDESLEQGRLEKSWVWVELPNDGNSRKVYFGSGQQHSELNKVLYEVFS